MWCATLYIICCLKVDKNILSVCDKPQKKTGEQVLMKGLNASSQMLPGYDLFFFALGISTSGTPYLVMG